MAHDIYHHRPTVPDTETSNEQPTTNKQPTHSTDGRLRKTALFVSMSIGQLMAAGRTNAQEEIPAPPPDAPAINAKDDQERRFSIEPKDNAPPLLEEVERPENGRADWTPEQWENFRSCLVTFVRLRAKGTPEWKEEVRQGLLAERALNGDNKALNELQLLRLKLLREKEITALEERVAAGDTKAVSELKHLKEVRVYARPITAFTRNMAIGMVRRQYLPSMEERAEQLGKRMNTLVTVDDLREAMQTINAKSDVLNAVIVHEKEPVISDSAPLSAVGENDQ